MYLDINYTVILVELVFGILTLVIYILIYNDFRKLSKEEGSPSITNGFILYRILFIGGSPIFSVISFINNLIQLRELSEKIEKNKKQVELNIDSNQQEKDSNKVEKQDEVFLQIKTDVKNTPNIVDLIKKINKHSNTAIKEKILSIW